MRLVEPWFGRYDRAWTLFNVLSIEFEIELKVHTLEGLEGYIRGCGEDLRVEIRYADEPYGEAAAALKQVFALFDRLRDELGRDHFDYVLLPREQVTIDLSPCKYVAELWLELRRKMEWDDWYGENFDALWDILTGLPYKGDDFTILRPRHYTGIPYGDNEGFTEYVDKLCGIFQKAQDREGNITVELRYTDEENRAGQNDSYLL